MNPTAAGSAKPVIPDKLYFRIGEVAQLAGVEPYVLRYWETEFSKLMPKKSGTGHRLYRRKDVELVLELKHLLYEKRFTIEGARLYLEQNRKKAADKKQQAPPVAIQAQASLFGGDGKIDPAKLEPLKTEVRALIAMLAAQK
jgi:DNA-binding transcriptional MerR regulator